MTKTLLVDTNFSSGPIYDALIKRGHEVHVIGANPNDCLAMKAAHYWKVDYSDAAAVKELIELQQFDYVVPGCTDQSYATCTEVGYRNFPGYNAPAVNQKISRKPLFKTLAEDIGLPTPKRQALALADLSYPLIVKPADAFSGKGVAIIRSKDELGVRSAIDVAKAESPTGECIIEDYAKGQLYSYSCFIESGKVDAEFLVIENSTANPFVVDTSHVLTDFSPAFREQLRISIEKLTQHLQLADGLIHTQFIANEQQLWMIELTRRCPGDLYSQLIELSTGFNYVERYIAPFIDAPAAPAGRLKQQSIIRHTISVKESQSFGALTFNQPVRFAKWVPLSIVGANLRPSPYSRIAVIFIQATTSEEFHAINESLLSRTLYEITS
jgi:carbamoylphosphate synthase large subunit